jgi:cell division protein FtsQ
MNLFGRRDRRPAEPPRRPNARRAPPPAPAEARAARRRSWRRSLGFALAVAFPSIFGVGALGALVYAADLAADYLDESSGFRVERIEVAGNERLTREEVLSRAGLVPGSSIFDVDIQEARRRLLLDPWIVRAFVEKKMPATVLVRLVERRPIAILSGDRALHLVGEDAAVIAPVRTADVPDLPVLTGFDLDRRRTDPVGLREELETAVDLLRLVDEVGMPGRRTIAELHLSVRGGFDLIAGDGLVVHLGQGPYRPKLRRLSETVAALAARSLNPAEIFLPGTRHPSRVGVRLGP